MLFILLRNVFDVKGKCDGLTGDEHSAYESVGGYEECSTNARVWVRDSYPVGVAWVWHFRYYPHP